MSYVITFDIWEVRIMSFVLAKAKFIVIFRILYKFFFLETTIYFRESTLSATAT